jgi:hypothetical protein
MGTDAAFLSSLDKVAIVEPGPTHLSGGDRLVRGQGATRAERSVLVEQDAARHARLQVCGSGGRTCVNAYSMIRRARLAPRPSWICSPISFGVAPASKFSMMPSARIRLSLTMFAAGRQWVSIKNKTAAT